MAQVLSVYNVKFIADTWYALHIIWAILNELLSNTCSMSGDLSETLS